MKKKLIGIAIELGMPPVMAAKQTVSQLQSWIECMAMMASIEGDKERANDIRMKLALP